MSEKDWFMRGETQAGAWASVPADARRNAVQDLCGRARLSLLTNSNAVGDKL
jgi:hypothetical protein